jgi:sigma-54-specific transcriptional regulator
MSESNLLTFPEAASMALSIRAKALLFHDPRSVALLEQVERIGRSEATVLVVGETGTGKELIARHVHKRSGRQGPFVAVNCGAFSETLIDAELFGHEAGAFTGAVHARAGWFEAANGGTLFLDEIGDLPIALQAKLLRVLQERQVVRLGSRKPMALDVRLVAATNVDLHQAVQAQRFRSDLYYRLSVAAVNLPPLRERPGDILPLARHFIGLYAVKLGIVDPTFSPDAECALLAYAWPGNIRELENVVHYALIVCREGVVRAGDFRFSPLSLAGGAEPPPVQTSTHVDLAVHRHHGIPAHPAAAVATGEDPTATLQRAFARLLAERPDNLFRAVEGQFLAQAFAHCGDNQVQTARLLGITRNTLRTLLKRHGLLASALGELDLAESEADEEAEAQLPPTAAAHSFAL